MSLFKEVTIWHLSLISNFYHFTSLGKTKTDSIKMWIKRFFFQITWKWLLTKVKLFSDSRFIFKYFILILHNVTSLINFIRCMYLICARFLSLYFLKLEIFWVINLLLYNSEMWHVHVYFELDFFLTFLNHVSTFLASHMTGTVDLNSINSKIWGALGGIEIS